MFILLLVGMGYTVALVHVMDLIEKMDPEIRYKATARMGTQMERVKSCLRIRSSLVLFLVLVSATALLSACGANGPAETPEVATIEATATAPEEAATREPEATPGDEVVQDPESSNPGLTAVIVSGDSAGTGKPFTFDATQSDPGQLDIVNYQWNMGDGTTLFGISVQHVYEEPGLYTVTLTVVDEEGNADVTASVAEIVQLVEEPPLEADGEFTLVGSRWTLNYPLRGTTLTLEFNEKALSGLAGCNTYSADYTAAVSEEAPASISISAVAITSSQACTAEIMYQEEGYLDSLASASTITVIGSTLTLETGSGTLTFSQVETTG